MSRPIAADVRLCVCVSVTPRFGDTKMDTHAPWTRDGLRTRASVKKVNELPSRRPGIAEAVNGALGLRSGWKIMCLLVSISTTDGGLCSRRWPHVSLRRERLPRVTYEGRERRTAAFVSK